MSYRAYSPTRINSTLTTSHVIRESSPTATTIRTFSPTLNKSYVTTVYNDASVPVVTGERYTHLSTEVDRLASQHGALRSENDSLRLQLDGKLGLIAENERLRSELAHARAIQSNVSSLEIKINQLVLENQRLQNQSTERLHEIESWKVKSGEVERANNRISLLLGENERLNHEVQVLRSSYSELRDLEPRVNTLTNENRRLSSAYSDLLHESDGLKVRSAELERVQSRNTLLQSENERLLQEILSLRPLRNEVNTLEAKNGVLSGENQRLSGLYHERIQEVDTWKVKFLDLERNALRADLLAGENSRLLSEIQSLRSLVGNTKALEGEISHLNARIRHLTDENERLSYSLSEKMRLVEEWSTKYSSLESLYLSVKEATAHLDIVKQKYQDAVNRTEYVEPNLRYSTELSQKTKNALRQSGYTESSAGLSSSPKQTKNVSYSYTRTSGNY